MEPDAHSVNQHPPSGPSSEPRSTVCEQCGHQIKSSAKRLRVGDRSFICDQCYKHLSFPESMIRCSE